MVTYSGSVLFPSLQHARDLPEFATLRSLNRRNWPQCLLWHAWLPGLGGISDDDSWASSFGELAFVNLERCLGAYPVDLSGSWTPPDYWDADEIALEMSEHPNIWTDGSREDFSFVGGFEVAGAGVCLLASEVAIESAVWGVAEGYGDARLERCRAFMPVPGPLQTVQGAEFWGAIVAMQAYWPCHLGLDYLHVAWTVGRLLDHGCLVKLLPLVKDGDLVALVQYMIRTRGRETVRVTKVKGHADDADVQSGRVRLADQLGKGEADTAADLGRRHQSEVLIDARRRLLIARSYWYPIMLQLHRFMISVARVTVNHDGRGGTALTHLSGTRVVGRRKLRRTDIRVNIDLASLPGPCGFLHGSWMQVHGGCITGLDVAAWPNSVGILCEFEAFFFWYFTLACWCAVDMGHFGVSFLEILILFEQWASHRLLSEKVTRPHFRPNRPIFILSAPVSEGVENRQGVSLSVALMARVVLLLIPLFGIKVVGRKLVSLPFG